MYCWWWGRGGKGGTRLAVVLDVERECFDVELFEDLVSEGGDERLAGEDAVLLVAEEAVTQTVLDLDGTRDVSNPKVNNQPRIDSRK